ncbi:hypothetical protein GDO81_021667 [Engystomops pustulosus]|uniref:Uncharacterized protein n=1 Tax=Engystomops pustulosus TaxID=76066 RepID=A0AAV6Z5N4_ENGPU|nr:hypothetical protein GDO81_021667 [Engystomops pustulosus]
MLLAAMSQARDPREQEQPGGATRPQLGHNNCFQKWQRPDPPPPPEISADRQDLQHIAAWVETLEED